MNGITLTTNHMPDVTVVSNIFIDTFMPRADGSYVKVYLYLLRCLNCNGYNISISSIADKLDHSEKDIIRALKYWENSHLITLGCNSSNEITNITINDIKSAPSNQNNTNVSMNLNTINHSSSGNNPSNHNTSNYISHNLDNKATPNTMNSDYTNNNHTNSDYPNTNFKNNNYNNTSYSDRTLATTNEYTSTESLSSSDPLSNNVTVKKNTSLSSNPKYVLDKPTYTQSQITELTNSDEIKWLMNIIEIYLERLLKPMDIQLILYLYESLGFSTDLIMYLYEYCVSKNKKNPSYIEAVALSWAEEGIDCVEKAEATTVMYNSNYNAVNKAFGLNRAPGAVEKQFINKWLSKYGFDIAIIVEACNRTILQTQKPDFKYADKILDNWSKANVKHLSDVSRLDSEHTKTTLKSQPRVVAPKATSNKFNAFPQRSYTNEDYSSMEQRLLNKN